MGKIIKNGTTYGVSYGDLYDIGYYAKGRYYYVDSDNGSDSNDGTSYTTPFKTIQKAVQATGMQYSNGALQADTILVNTSATNSYDGFWAFGGIILRISGYDPSDGSVDNTGILRISNSTTGNAVEIMESIVYLNTNTNISAPNGTALRVRDHSTLYLTNSSGQHTFSGATGVAAERNSTIEFQGSVGNNSLVTASSTSASAISCSRGSQIIFNGSLNATSSGASTVGASVSSYINFYGSGSSTSKIGTFTIRNTGTSGCIQCNQSGGVNVSGSYTVDLRVTNSSSTVSVVHCAQYSSAIITGTGTLYGSTAGNASVLRAYNGSTINWSTSGTMTTNAMSVPTSGVTSYAIDSYTGSKIYFHSSTVTGYGGIRATQGGEIAYSSITNNATNKTATATGGRIYSGNQTSIPNY